MPIHYERDDEHIVLITIDRPEARNSADMEHFKLLREAWERFDADDDAWVAIITGVGDAFFTGADLKRYVPEITKFQKQIAEEGLTEINGYRLDDGTRAVLRNWPLYKPIVAAVNGFCTAGGMEMLGGVDIRVACPEAKFAVMEPKRGLFAGGGTTVRLPRQVPWAQAMEFLLCADLIEPSGPTRWACSTRSFLATELLDAAYAFARRMTANAPLAVKATKQSALQGLYHDEDTTKQLRAAVAPCAAHRPTNRPSATRRPSCDRVGRRHPRSARQGAAHRLREGEPALERDLPDRGREGGTEGVRREAPAELAGQVNGRGDRSAQPVHHRRRQPHLAPRNGRRRRVRPEPLEMWVDVATKRPDAGRAARCSRRSTASTSSTARRASTTTRRRGSRSGWASSPRTGSTRASAARRRSNSSPARPTRSSRASATSCSSRVPRRSRRSAGRSSAASDCSTRSGPTERRPYPWEAPLHPAEVAHDVFQAWLTFAVFDNARRAHLGIGLDDYRRGIGEMMAPLTEIAARNPDAWFPIARTVDEIVVRADNRMVGYPYTKYMVAIMDVDMAAAVIVASHERADALGVPQDQRVYLRGWCYATDPVYVAEHRDMWRSPAMAAAAGRRCARRIGDRRRRAPRSLQLLREQPALRPRRARHLARRHARSASPADCRITAVPAAAT